MKSVQEIKIRLREINDIKDSNQRLSAYRNIFADINEIENVAAKSFGSVPLNDIYAIQDMVPDVIAGINRLEAGKERARQNKKYNE